MVDRGDHFNPTPIDTDKGRDEGSMTSMEFHRARDPYYDNRVIWKGHEVERDSSVLFYNFIGWLEMGRVIAQLTPRPVSFTRWNAVVGWGRRGNVWRVLMATPDLATSMIQKGPIVVGDYKLVPKRVPLVQRRRIGKHYDKRLKTKLWWLESVYLQLDTKEVEKIVCGVKTNPKMEFRSINRHQVEGVDTNRWRVLTVGPGVIPSDLTVCGAPVKAWRVPKKRKQAKKYPTNTSAQGGPVPSHAKKIPSKDVRVPTKKAWAPKASTGGSDSLARTDSKRAEKPPPVSKVAVIEEPMLLDNTASQSKRPEEGKRKATDSLSIEVGRGAVARRVEESSDSGGDTEEMDSEDEYNEKLNKEVLPRANCKQCSKVIRVGLNRIRREENHWCFGCTKCAKCKEDFRPVKVIKEDNKIVCKCGHSITMVKCSVTFNGSEIDIGKD